MFVMWIPFLLIQKFDLGKCTLIDTAIINLCDICKNKISITAADSWHLYYLHQWIW